MSDEPAGYDFFYDPEVRVLLPSLARVRGGGIG